MKKISIKDHREKANVLILNKQFAFQSDTQKT